MKSLSAALLAVLVAACGGKKDEPASTQPPATKTEPAPAAKDAPASAPVDPATFVAIDLAAVPSLASVAAKGPPGATVTADDPPFNQTESLGAVIAQGDFALHLRWGTVGGERSTVPMKLEMEGRGTYVETTSTPELVEYTADAKGTKTYGLFRPIAGFRREKNDPYSQLLCGPAKEVASSDALAPYRAACDAVTKN